MTRRAIPGFFVISLIRNPLFLFDNFAKLEAINWITSINQILNITFTFGKGGSAKKEKEKENFRT